MNATAIPRMTFTKPSELQSLENERIKLAQSASDKLGYRKLAQAIATPGALLFALRELGIEPLQSAKVETYKASKERTGIYSGTKETLATLFVLAAAIGFAITIGNTPEISGAGWIAPFVLSVAIAIVSFVRLMFLLIEEHIGHGNRTTLRWKSYSLAGYHGNVPEHVLSRALEVKNRVTNADFQVFQLVKETERLEIPQKDPFLGVSLGNEFYYLDVWDEKEYERTI